MTPNAGGGAISLHDLSFGFPARDGTTLSVLDGVDRSLAF